MLLQNMKIFFIDSGLAIPEILENCFVFPSLTILGLLLVIYLLVITLFYYPKKKTSNQPKNYPMENAMTNSLLYYSSIVLLYLAVKQAYFVSSTTYISYYLYSTPFTQFLENLVLFTSSMIFWYLRTSQNKYKKTDEIHSPILHRLTVIMPEIPYLFLFSVWFLILLINSNHLLITFMALVGFSLSLYVLITIFPQTEQIIRSNWTARYEAGIKYFFLSTFSSSLVLLTAALVYIFCQTNNLMEIQKWLISQQNINPLFIVASITLLLGLAFKISAFPSHFWAPEVYQGSDDSVAAFILLPVKIAALGVLTQLLVTSFSSFYFFWKYVVLAMSVGSMVWGAFGAFRATKIKQFLAFSSINQVGFMLVGLATNTVQSIENTLLFLIIYVFTNVLFFLLFLQQKSVIYLSEISSSDPLTKFGWTIVFFSLAGIPPFAGFFAKFYILMEAFNVFDNAYRFTVLIGIVTSLVSAYYYLRFIKNLWFDSKKGIWYSNVTTSINDIVNFYIVQGFSKKYKNFIHRNMNPVDGFVELIFWLSSLILLIFYWYLHDFLTFYCHFITKYLMYVTI